MPKAINTDELTKMQQRIIALQAVEVERMRVNQLLQALNNAYVAMGKTLAPNSIFSAGSNEFKKLGFVCAVFTLDENNECLLPAYLSYNTKMIRAAEKLPLTVPAFARMHAARRRARPAGAKTGGRPRRRGDARGP